MRTQVGIVGAGPAGLLLSHLLHLAGIGSVIVESRSRAHVEARIRAGVLEQGTVDTLVESGLGERLAREGLVHRGIHLSFGGARHAIDFEQLTGHSVTIYGQHEVVKDLLDARTRAGADIVFEVEETSVYDLDSERPVIRYRKDGQDQEIVCDFIAGCDGYHGVCRPSIPPGVLRIFERTYTFAWLGILADAPATSDELVYANHERGFALYSMRSPELTRLYLQCRADEDIADWPDERIWDELHRRLETDAGWRVAEGPILQRGITPLRSVVVEPMRYGRLYLAGDAAHIVPPTGAKGLNLAVADVRVLAKALASFYRAGRTALLDAYSATCLERTWRVQRFSWWMTAMLHRFDASTEFDRQIQLAELSYVTSSRAAARSLAENYVGLPLSV
ncbi:MULTISPECIES: 4-hydroxybenzoate 3-monooxygenase [Rhodomicrobium]|uniref:4-hydroxybenzoate 3-monooxygenase n=1 Tax=Rhodomicrobium TaxID=1068 RepID=UPI000B4AF87D|nr:MULTISPECIES: 4-hydroxybenzoate 3-monooxygenase [Rhodomicrobium]